MILDVATIGIIGTLAVVLMVFGMLYLVYIGHEEQHQPDLDDEDSA